MDGEVILEDTRYATRAASLTVVVTLEAVQVEIREVEVVTPGVADPIESVLLSLPPQVDSQGCTQNAINVLISRLQLRKPETCKSTACQLRLRKEKVLV